MLIKKVMVVVVFVLMLFAGTIQAGGEVSSGQSLVESIGCADCHGDDGLGDDETPAIAGLDMAKILKDLTDFKTGIRVDEYEVMVEMAAELSEHDIADLAAYYASLAGE